MKIKKYLLLVCLVGSSNAATLNVSNITPAAAGSRILVDSNNNTLKSGYIAVGYFNNLTAPQFATSTGLDLENDFNVLGSAGNSFEVDFASSGSIIPGGIDFSASATTSSTVNSDFIGKMAYVVIGNASSLALATEAFIYAVGLTIPEDPSTGIGIDLSTSSLAGTIEFGSGDGVANVLLGANDLGQISNALKTAVLVPEPSSLLLSAIGALALLRRKR